MAMDTPVSFGLWLRQRRKLLDLTQERLAERVGCSVSAIRKIESDERRPSREVAELLATALAIDPKNRPTFLKVARSELRVERLAAIESARTSAPVPAPAYSNLPIPNVPLVGRIAELAQLTQLL